MTQPSSIETIGLDTVTQKSMIDTINLLIDKGYCKYNLDNTQGLKIIAANKSTRIISRGYNNSICEVPMGDRPYSYGLVRGKTTGEELGVVYFNINHRYKQYYTNNVATALGDILSHQYQCYMNYPEELVISIRSTFAVVLALKVARELGANAFEKLATTFDLRDFSGKLNMLKHNIQEDSILECMAYCFVADKEFSEVWSEIPDIVNRARGLDVKMYSIFNQLLNKEEVSFDEIQEAYELIKKL